jgi:CRP-like cAMP-binding protein
MDYRQFPLFSRLTTEEFTSFLRDCGEVVHPAGVTFLTQGKSGGRIYYLVEGELEVYLDAPDGGRHELAILAAPAVVGELEALTGDPTAANVGTKTPVRLLEMDYEVLRRRFDAGDPAALKVFFHTARVLARRLVAMNEKFAELQRDALPRRHELRAFQEKLLNEWTF